MVVLSPDVAQQFFEKTQEYFMIKLHLPFQRSQFKQTVYERLLSEFVSAAKINIPEGSKTQVYLNAILRLSDVDFKTFLREFLLRTQNMDFRDPKDDELDILMGKDGTTVSFFLYLESLRRKRILGKFLMGCAKDQDRLEKKEFDREFEEKCINDTIASCKKSGYGWLEENNNKWLEETKGKPEARWFKQNQGKDEGAERTNEGNRFLD